MTEIEKAARAKWFAFELVEVQTKFHGDWEAFTRAKDAEEARFAREAEAAPESPRYGKPTAEGARARRLVQREFREVAQARTDEIRALAKKVITALQKGDVEALVDDCVMYDASNKDRAALTRAWLTEHKAELMKMAKLADPTAPGFAGERSFDAPSPERGMTASVTIPFGPIPKPPKEADLYPERYQLELMWSGEVMPEANGPLFSAPQPNPPPSRWRFYQLTAPYSLRRAFLE